jgi:hypothetical protein
MCSNYYLHPIIRRDFAFLSLSTLDPYYEQNGHHDTGTLSLGRNNIVGHIESIYCRFVLSVNFRCVNFHVNQTSRS